jgi:hypothetical protein
MIRDTDIYEEIVVGVCPCIITAEFMTRYGAVNAGKMHFDKAAATPQEASPRDWQVHIEEEDKYWRPMAVEHFPLLVAILDEDHRVFLRELATHRKIVSVARMAAHSSMEDWITLRLIDLGY